MSSQRRLEERCQQPIEERQSRRTCGRRGSAVAAARASGATAAARACHGGRCEACKWRRSAAGRRLVQPLAQGCESVNGTRRSGGAKHSAAGGAGERMLQRSSCSAVQRCARARKGAGGGQVHHEVYARVWCVPQQRGAQSAEETTQSLLHDRPAARSCSVTVAPLKHCASKRASASGSSGSRCWRGDASQKAARARALPSPRARTSRAMVISAAAVLG